MIAIGDCVEGNPGGTIVTDSITSSGLKEYIEGTFGGVHLSLLSGQKTSSSERALRLNQEGVNCPLAIETSAMRHGENYFPDDGPVGTKIIIQMARLRAEGKT